MNETIAFMMRNIEKINERISVLQEMKANRELYQYDWKWENSWCAAELDERYREQFYFQNAVVALTEIEEARQKIKKATEQCEWFVGHYGGEDRDKIYAASQRMDVAKRVLDLLEGGQ